MMLKVCGLVQGWAKSGLGEVSGGERGCAKVRRTFYAAVAVASCVYGF